MVASLFAEPIKTNEVYIKTPPQWLKKSRVESVTDRISQLLEWSIHRSPVEFFSSQQDFAKAQSMGDQAIAVTLHQDKTEKILLGPQVTSKNFDAVFGHELVHLIVAQKYKASIPKWFEEGLANFYAKDGTVDYLWLAKQPALKDFHDLGHPMTGSRDQIIYKYKASQALAEMLAKKCDLENLLRISLQRNLEDFIHSYCEIKDINQAFRDWVQQKSNLNNHVSQ